MRQDIDNLIRIVHMMIELIKEVINIFNDTNNEEDKHAVIAISIVKAIIVIPIALLILMLMICLLLFGCLYTLGKPMIILLGFLARHIMKLFKFLIERIKTARKKDTSLGNIYTQGYVAEILCKILQDNAKALEVTAPSVVNDIIPVKDTVLQLENGFLYYRFICEHPRIEEANFKNMLSLIDLKVSQYLQVHCYNYTIVHKDMPVVKVFNISESLWHPFFYDIYIMIIDSDEKYCYIKSLEQNVCANNTADTLDDEEF